MDELKLLALDADDLAVFSAHLQDAVLRLSDIVWQPRAKRFVMIVNRFDWDAAARGETRRRRTGLNFDRVGQVASAGLDIKDGERVLNLLAVTFEPGAAPAGAIHLTFSDGAGLKLTVECIEARMADLGAVWQAQSQPKHDLGGDI